MASYEYEKDIEYGEDPLHGMEVAVRFEEVKVYLFQCPLCNRPTLGEMQYEIFNTSGVFLNLEEDKLDILYPIRETRLRDLPYKVESKYQEALKVYRVSPASFAVMAGKTLEAVCKQENATGRTFSDKLNNLTSSDRMPKTLADMAHQVRQIRNLGAHNTEDEVTEEDVPIILDFLEAILEYLCVAPAKIAAVQAGSRRLLKPPPV